ncbi:MAG: Rrf2 family transcriptional regulator [Candidatus Omnitrophota bacterium]
MSLINRNTDYAIRALIWIAKKDKRSKLFSVSELNRCLKINKPFLRKILQVLVKKRILYSVKGVKGGFRLALSPEKISLLDLIKIFQGKIEFTRCLLNKKVCSCIRSCRLNKRIKKIEKYVAKELDNITIKNLI